MQIRSVPVLISSTTAVVFLFLSGVSIDWSVALAQGALSFTDVTAAVGMANTVTGSHGAFWADATGDGWPDLFLTYNECRDFPRRTNGLRPNRFYRNLGGSFAEETAARGLFSLTGGTHGGAWADVDNDGDYDLITGETYATDCLTEDPPALANRIYANDGIGRFIDRTPPAMAAYPPPGSIGEGYTRSILGFDMDRDGDLDIFAVNGDRGTFEPFPDRNELYRNDGAFQFSAITSGPLINTPAGQAGADVDYDGDGDIDIIMPNTTGPLGVIRNDGGVFTALPPESIGIVHRAATGISSGDLNGDGLTDLILIDQDRKPFRRLGWDRVAYIYLSEGGGRFRFHAEVPSGYFGGYTAGLADLDNDADLDLVLPGFPFVLLNDGAANFSAGPFYPSPVPPPGCIDSDCTLPDMRTVAFADFDNDGDEDLVVTTKFGPFYMIRNNFNQGNWLKVRLMSPLGQAGAFGAKVRIFRPGTKQLIALREAKNVYGYLSQDDPVLHIGLGTATTVDVEVTFLDGTRVTRPGVGAKQLIAFVGTTIADAPGAPRNLAAVVTGSMIALSWNPPISGGPVVSYQLEATTVPGLTNLGVFPVGAALSTTASAPDGTYHLRVRARNGVGLGAASDEITFRVGGCPLPGPPAAFTFTVSGFAVTLSWSPPVSGPAPAAYTIEVGSQPGATDLAVIDTGFPALTLSANAPPGRYFARVRARTTCGMGVASNEAVIDVR